MSEQDPELEAFSKFIVAIEPWLGEVVLVGGWTHRNSSRFSENTSTRRVEIMDLTGRATRLRIFVLARVK